MKKKIILNLLLVASLTLSFVCINAVGAVEPSERFKGYNLQRGKWVVGNLGKDYVEGDFVSYQLRIGEASKIWGASEFSISFNFHQPCSGAIYVDGFDTSVDTGFQYSTMDFLPHGKEVPDPGWGTHIPTPEAGETWTSGPRIINYMDEWPPGIGDGTPAGSSPAKERYFTVEGIDWSASSHIILFFRAHLALDVIWSAGLEADLTTELDGDEFDGWTASWKGASFATGSSRHFYLQFDGIGAKTIPIPIAQYPSTLIYGEKIVCNGRDPYDGQEIILTGELSLDSLPPIPLSSVSVLTGTGSWSTGYYEFPGLIEGSYTVQEGSNTEYPTLKEINTAGDGTNVVPDLPGRQISFDLPREGTQWVQFYNKVS